MNKFFLAILGVVVLVPTINAQQLPLQSQYMENMLFLNPAYTGVKKGIPVTASFRDQWVGIKDAPITYTLTANSQFSKNVALGAILYSDNTGPLSQTGIQITYAYHLMVSNTSYLSFGIGGSYSQHVLDESKLTLDQPVDALITGGKQTSYAPDATFGIYYYGKRYFAGFSAPHLLKSKIKYKTVTGIENMDYRHYYFAGGYRFKASDKVDIEPSMLLKFVEASPMQFDINFKGIYEKKYWVGFSYRDEDAVVAMLGLNYNQLSFGYSYDITTSNLRHYSAGSHEIFIGYVFGENNSKKDKNQSQIGTKTESVSK